MTSKKTALIMLTVVMLISLLSGCSGAANTVGVLDVQKVMTESPKVKQFQEQLNAKGKEVSDQLEKEKATLSQEDFQKKQEQLYGEFLKSKQDFESQIDSSIKKAMEDVSKEKKLGVILYKNSVAQGGVDVTDDVIKKMQ